MTNSKPPPKPKLTDPDRHKRFLEMAHELGVAENKEVPPNVIKKIVKSTRALKTISRP